MTQRSSSGILKLRKLNTTHETFEFNSQIAHNLSVVVVVFCNCHFDSHDDDFFLPRRPGVWLSDWVLLGARIRYWSPPFEASCAEYFHGWRVSIPKSKMASTSGSPSEIDEMMTCLFLVFVSLLTLSPSASLLAASSVVFDFRLLLYISDELLMNCWWIVRQSCKMSVYRLC